MVAKYVVSVRFNPLFGREERGLKKCVVSNLKEARKAMREKVREVREEKNGVKGVIVGLICEKVKGAYSEGERVKERRVFDEIKYQDLTEEERGKYAEIKYRFTTNEQIERYEDIFYGCERQRNFMLSNEDVKRCATCKNELFCELVRCRREEDYWYNKQFNEE